MSFAELRKNNEINTKQDELEISKLQQIEKDIMDVNTIYNDLNKMVATDNEKIEKITEKVEETNDKITQSNDTLLEVGTGKNVAKKRSFQWGITIVGGAVGAALTGTLAIGAVGAVCGYGLAQGFIDIVK